MQVTSQQQYQALETLIREVGTSVSPSTLLPASDYFDLAGEEFGRRLLLTEGANGTQYCLRPDFTLPIAKAYMSGSESGPASYTYLGPVFRQRNTGPTEFDQAGLELLAQPNPETALHTVFDFTQNALNIFDQTPATIRLGSVALFEALLATVDMPDVWRPRLRRRFGNKNAMQALLVRLASPVQEQAEAAPKSREQLLKQITEQMQVDGLSLVEGRTPDDIADRYLEKRALAAAKVPHKTIELLQDYLTIKDQLQNVLPKISNLTKAANISLEQTLDDVETHARTLSQRFPKSEISFETSFSPRLHYYTGLVFEMHNGAGKTLVSGGQYDRLLQALGAKNQISASGCALWVKRLQSGGEL